MEFIFFGVEETDNGQSLLVIKFTKYLFFGDIKMTVKEAFNNLKKLVDEGHGDVVLMGFNGQGDSADGAVGDEVEKVTGEETMGEILDMEVGTEYVSVYMG